MLLLSLPDELFGEVSRICLAADLISALRLRQTCQGLRRRLEAVTAEAERRRLQWLPELITGDSGADYVLHRNVRISKLGYTNLWAIGPRLPTTGKSSWEIVVDSAPSASLRIGVCDILARCCWCLCLRTGKLNRFIKDADGFIIAGRKAPDGFPDGHNTQVIAPNCLCSDAQGTEIEVVVDHDEGSLGFRIQNDLVQPPLLEAIKAGGFPRGAPLLVMAMLVMEGDQLTFTAPYMTFM